MTSPIGVDLGRDLIWTSSSSGCDGEGTSDVLGMKCFRLKSPGGADVGLVFLTSTFGDCSNGSDERRLADEGVEENIWLSPDSISLFEW